MSMSPLILAARILRLTPLRMAAAALDADWEESKHPRKANGQFGSGGSPPQHESGGVSGALNEKNDPDRKRRDAHAKKVYTRIIKGGEENFAAMIHSKTGYSKQKLRNIFRHVFINTHKLAGGIGPFFEDFDMAQSFDRLLRGEFYGVDLVMLQHEYLEYCLEKRYNLTYSEAHAIAERKFNYSREIKRVKQYVENGKGKGKQ